jgi:hypothetical protein
VLDFLKRIRANQDANIRTNTGFAAMLIALDKVMKAGDLSSHKFGTNGMIAEAHLLNAALSICKAITSVDPTNMTARQLTKKFREKLDALSGR